MLFRTGILPTRHPQGLRAHRAIVTTARQEGKRIPDKNCGMRFPGRPGHGRSGHKGKSRRFQMKAPIIAVTARIATKRLMLRKGQPCQRFELSIR